MIFLDLETTGLDPRKHVVIDIAFKILDLKSKQIITSFQALIIPDAHAWSQKDPNSININGYTWEELVKGESRENVSKKIIDCLQTWKIERGKSFFVCQNPGFDRCFFAQLVDPYVQESLRWPYHWLDMASMYWILSMQKISVSHAEIPSQMNLSKNAIASIHGLPPEIEPHRAVNGVDHLMACCNELLKFQS